MSEPVMDIQQIKKLLPHRYPFLMLDRVLELEAGKYCKALKNVTGNEACFQGHFPNSPLFPGVLQIEAMAQASGLAAVVTYDDITGMLPLFVGINKARFKRQVVPGDQLIVETKFVNHKLNIWVFDAKVTVEGNVTCQAEIRVASVKVET